MEHFAHAYIIYGGSPASREEAALGMIKKMISSTDVSLMDDTVSRRIDTWNYPDILAIRPQKGSIPIDTVRGIKDFLSYKPVECAMKFVVICECQLMRAEGQNAMLKLLEETPEGRAIFLLADSLERILPTVLSRLQQVRLPDAQEETGQTDMTGEVLRLLSTVLLEGDIPALFDLSALLAKDRQETMAILTELYGIFHGIYVYLSGAGPLTDERSRYISGYLNAPLADRISGIIRDTLSDIMGNASMNIASEAMLIAIREAYNAEDRWDKV